MRKPTVQFTPEQVVLQLADSSRKLADLTANMVYDEPELMDVLLEVSLKYEAQIAQRASRVMSICCEQFPELASPYIPKIIRGLKSLKYEGPTRNLLKILADVPLKLSEKQTSILINDCFDYLTGNYAVALKVYSMEILYKFTTDFPDIGQELAHILEDQIPDASAGYRSRAHKILKKLPRPS
jgi:hypothetical protein